MIMVTLLILLLVAVSIGALYAVVLFWEADAAYNEERDRRQKLQAECQGLEDKVAQLRDDLNDL